MSGSESGTRATDGRREWIATLPLLALQTMRLLLYLLRNRDNLVQFDEENQGRAFH